MSRPSLTSARLDFDRLVREYLENLNVNLRGFRPADFDFLETWVPNDDPTEGLIELVTLGREAGLERLVIAVEIETFERIDLARLEGEIGVASRTVENGQTVFDFTLSGPNPNIHPAYLSRLHDVLRAISHEGTLAPQDGQDVLTVSREGVTLAVLLDSRKMIAQARFHGTATPAHRGLMELLCATMEGKPVQECADHAPLAVEAALRDPTQTPPVPGLITPENADPAFALPVALVRALRDEFARHAGTTETKNFYDRPVSERWLRLTIDQRGEAVRTALAAGGLGDLLDVVGLDGPKRIVVRFAHGLSSVRQQELLVQCEEIVRQTVETGLHAVAQATVDKNILRISDKKRPGGLA